VTELQVGLISILVFLALDLLTIAARTGLVLASRARLEGQQSRSDARMPRTLALLDQQTAARQSLHLTLVLLRLLLAGSLVLVFELIVPDFRFPFTLALLLLAGLALWMCEFLVERLISRDPEDWALRLSSFIRFITVILGPFFRLTSVALGDSEGHLEKTGAITEDELKTLVDASQREGVLEQDEREMIFSIFRFGDTLAREIMIPRIDVLALEKTAPIDEAVDILLASGFSRVPVYDRNIDNIRGLLYVKDLLRVLREGRQETSLEKTLRPAYFIPETKKLNELLEEMQAQRIHMAIVVDEYGGMAGVVTLEDIVEEIIGEIRDEYDQSEELLYQQVDDTEYVFHGRIDLDDFNVFMHSRLPGDDADTLGGYIYSQIGRVPKGGESLRVDNILLTVEQVVGRRIRKVRAQRLPADNGEGLVPSPNEA
jgi:magnesium and cobalt exporter, CNNM family